MELPASHHWAKLSARHIARFGELTKREIQVICVLFLSRNGSNNRCNPKRKTIAAAAGLRPPNVTIAIGGLESKGWVVEMPDGEFHLFDADEIPAVVEFSTVEEKVTKLVTTDPEPDPEKVTKLVTQVTKSVTENYQIGNSLNKELNRDLTEKEQKARAPRKKSKRKSIATRIPEPFELTDEMIDWAKANLPALRLVESHADFVEYWTNNETKRATAINWRLRWEKGMRLLMKWQIRDDRNAGIEIVDPACNECQGSGRGRNTLETFPCSICKPSANRAYWKSRGKG
jgi:hypothetical protein